MPDAKTATPDDIIEIPSDEIQLGADADGMPKTIPGEKSATGKPIEAEADDAAGKEAARVAALEKERNDAVARAERMEREAAAERAKAAEALELAARRGQDLDKRTGEAVGAHRAAVRETYGRVAADYQQITSGISNAQAMLAQAEADLAAAHTNGDGARIAQLTSHVGRLAGDLRQLEGYKPSAEAALNEAKATWEDTERAVGEIARKKADEPAPDTRPKGPRDHADFATNYADQWIDKAPRAVQSWLRDHKDEVIKDAKKFKQLNAFASLYESENGDGSLNSRDFEKALEAKFYPKAKDEDNDVSEREPEEPEVVEERPKPKRTPAAPVSRGTVFSSKNPNARQIKLPPDVADFVRKSGLDAAQYALQVHEDIRTGKLPKEWLDPDYDRGIR